MLAESKTSSLNSSPTDDQVFKICVMKQKADETFRGYQSEASLNHIVLAETNFPKCTVNFILQ